MNYNPNPYGGYPKTPEQLQAEINAALRQYQDTFNTYRRAAPPVQQTQQTRRCGEYVEVADYQEMESADTRLDGVPTLFVDFKNRVFWSKKWVNGAHSVQAFHFESIIGAPQAVEPEEQKIDYVEELGGKASEKYDERLSKLEDSMSAVKDMLEKLLGKEAQRGNRRSNKGSECDIRPETGAGDGT